MQTFGSMYMTAGVRDAIAYDDKFSKEVTQSIARYRCCDWGELCELDKKRNDEALIGYNRIFAAYETSKGKLWIITEPDKSATTILFPSEY